MNRKIAREGCGGTREIENDKKFNVKRNQGNKLKNKRDTYTLNCVNEKQSKQEVTSANAIIDSGVAFSKIKD